MIQNKKLTIDDVAEALGVSKTTVSRAISGKGRIGVETKERVLEYIKEHNYKPNVIAKGLAQSKTYNIGILMPEDYNLIDLPFFQSCLMGVCNTASSLDYDVLISVVSENDITQLKRMIANDKVDGVILTRTFVQDMAIDFLKEAAIPFVTIGSTEDKEVYQVDNNHLEACKELTSLLLVLGMKRIALIGGKETHIVTNNRLQGFLDAHISQNIPVNNELIYMNASNAAIIEKAVVDILSKGADCIICMDDMICEYVLRKLKKEHLQVPADIKVASFYNSALLEHSRPSITSLQFDILKLGNQACKALIDCIEGREIKKQQLLAYEIVLKESTK